MDNTEDSHPQPAVRFPDVVGEVIAAKLGYVATAEFIAAARSLVPRLLDALEHAQAEATHWRHVNEAEIELSRDRWRDLMATRAELARAEAKVAHYEERFPCDAGCHEYPEEDCSSHGRTPAELWALLLKDHAELTERAQRAEAAVVEARKAALAPVEALRERYFDEHGDIAGEDGWRFHRDLLAILTAAGARAKMGASE